MTHPPRIDLHVDPFVQPGMRLLRRLAYPFGDLAFRHFKGTASGQRLFVHGHVDLIAPIAPANIGVAENTAQVPLEKGDNPAKPGFVANLALAELSEEAASRHALSTTRPTRF